MAVQINLDERYGHHHYTENRGKMQAKSIIFCLEWQKEKDLCDDSAISHKGLFRKKREIVGKFCFPLFPL